MFTKITKLIHSQALLHFTKKTYVNKINEHMIWKRKLIDV